MPGTILVAEDDPEARELLILVLGGGYHILEAEDGLQAYELLNRETPDLLITDIVMPHMDGYELVRRARQDERTADIPVIFCSASYHEREVREMARSLGVLNTLAKPYEYEAVRNVVAAALASRVPAGMPNAAAPATPSPPLNAAEFLRSAQERLNAMVAFSRSLFAEDGSCGMARCASRAAREILLAQCAQVYIGDSSDEAGFCTESGLAEKELETLLGSQMYQQLRAVLREGGSAMFPMSEGETSTESRSAKPGDFVSMLGVPIASGSRNYGYLCVLNRIGMSAFTEEDLSIARAIAAQVAMAHENAVRRRELESEIARRTEMENEVRRLNHQLEARVSERTAELERANRELEAFSYSVAHDLRAPLRLIDAQVQMLNSGGHQLPRPVVVQLEQIQRGASHMSALIDGLLTLSRVRHVDMKRKPVALRMLVDAAIEMLSAETAGRTIDWRIGELPTVKCDPDLMLQVFVNLIGNAVKYTRAREQAQIEVGVDAGPQAHLFIRDNGVGFDMRYAAKLFGLFQRLHRQDEFEGTGIGLATVSRIVERHGGRVWAEAQVGQGAEFRFSLAALE